eukprot:4356110-Prymnesium_polylepis.1
MTPCRPCARRCCQESGPGSTPRCRTTGSGQSRTGSRTGPATGAFACAPPARGCMRRAAPQPRAGRSTSRRLRRRSGGSTRARGSTCGRSSRRRRRRPR